MDEDFKFDISFQSSSYSSFTFHALNIITTNIHHELIIINSDNTNATDATVIVSSSIINSARIIHENANIILKVTDSTFTQQHVYNMDNFEDYEDTIPSKGGYIISEATGSISIENSNFINCVSFEDGACIYCELCKSLEIDGSTFTHSIAFDGNGGAIASIEHEQFTITNSIFHNTTSYGDGASIFIVESGPFILTDSTFTDSQALDGKGGNIFIEEVESVIVTECDFFNGYSNDEAGCFVVEKSEFVIINNTNFIGCRSIDAGALVIDENEEAYLDNLQFINCHADGKGGGMREKSNAVLTNLYFENNHAGFNGGAFHLDTGLIEGEHIIVTMTDSTFINNSADYAGGAVHIETGKLVVDGSKFINNSSPNGGAASITAESADMGFFFTNCSFETNYAIKGGAIWVLYGTYHLIDCLCINNDATLMGGCLMDINPVRVENTVALIENSRIFNNSALISGGSIYFSGTSLEIRSTQFESNIVYGGIGGGAISVLKGELYGINNSFIDNNAANGGAMYISTESKLVSMMNDTLINNSATIHGGAIFGEKIFSSQRTTIDGCLFDGNHANFGGSIYLQDVNYNKLDRYEVEIRITTMQNPFNENIDNGGRDKWTPIIKNTVFSHNDRDAIYLQSVNIKMRENLFIDNIDGALYVDDGIIHDIESKFIGNANIEQCGGAIYHNPPDEDVNSLILNGTEFINNTAKSGGAICLASCPLSTTADTDNAAKYVQILNNVATESGAAIQLESTTDEICNFCIDEFSCLVMDNYVELSDDYNGTGSTLIESSYSSLPSSWEISANFENGSEIDNVFEISISAQLYDSYSNPVEYLTNEMTLDVHIENNHGLALLLASDENSVFGTYTSNAAVEFSINDDNINIADTEESIPLRLRLDIHPNPYKLDVRHYSLKYAINFQSVGVGSVIFLGVLIILTMIFIIISAGLLWYYRHVQIMRASTVSFMFLILFGLFLLCIALATNSAFKATTDKCAVNFILIHISIIFVVGPLGGKTWRLYQIFNKAKTLKVFRLKDRYLFIIFAGVPCILMVIYILIWIIIAQPKSAIVSSEAGYYYSACTVATGQIFFYVSLAIIGLPILWLTVLAYEARKLPKDFNETFWIGSTLYTILLNGLLCIPVLISSVDPFIKLQLTTIASIICINMIVVFLFWVKFYKAKYNIDKAGKTRDETSMASAQKSNNETVGDVSFDSNTPPNRSKTNIPRAFSVESVATNPHAII